MATRSPIYDLVIYGGTSGGIAAAVEAKRSKLSVVLIEPGIRLGGMTTGGLGWTDIGNKAAIGGISREFYRAVREHYDSPRAWKWQQRATYRIGGQGEEFRAHAAEMWTFEPHVALAVYRQWVKENGLKVVFGQKLDRQNGVARTGMPLRITSLRMESGAVFRGRMFIDATYEGDLMAAAGVQYHVGREGNSVYGETYNGVQTRRAKGHNLYPGIDPYVVPGKRSSGLLPFVNPDGPGLEGAGDRRVQAYNFRLCLTDAPKNRVPFAQPAPYQEIWYEALFRNFAAGRKGTPWINSPLPNHKTDTNNGSGFSTDFIGQSYDYPDASYARREKIIAQHLLYTQGLMWTLACHPRVPASVRAEVSRFGLAKDEFTESGHWPSQLYVREARRLAGPYVMTEAHCKGLKRADDSVGVAAYTIDSHNVQRYVDSRGRLRNEGNIEIHGYPPYPISYRALTPQPDQCANLLIPVCLSASHIAYGSIRMEPVFMVLGQSAAAAASLALKENVPVQKVNYTLLRRKLLAAGQVLAWK